MDWLNPSRAIHFHITREAGLPGGYDPLLLPDGEGQLENFHSRAIGQKRRMGSGNNPTVDGVLPVGLPVSAIGGNICSTDSSQAFAPAVTDIMTWSAPVNDPAEGCTLASPFPSLCAVA